MVEDIKEEWINPLQNLWKHKEYKEMNKTPQELKAKFEFIKKTQTEINLGTGTGTSEGSLVNVI